MAFRITKTYKLIDLMLFYTVLCNYIDQIIKKVSISNLKIFKRRASAPQSEARHGAEPRHPLAEARQCRVTPQPSLGNSALPSLGIPSEARQGAEPRLGSARLGSFFTPLVRKHETAKSESESFFRL